MISDRLRIKVSFVLQLIDDFTNQPIISPTVRVYGEGNYHPIRKEDGCYVFLNCPSEITITISSCCYHEKILKVDRSRLDTPILKVRLMPDRRYRLPEGTACIEGKAAPNSKVGVVLEQEDKSWKLLYDYQLETSALKIQIFNPSTQDLERRTFLIMDKKEMHYDIFEVQRCDMQEQVCYLKEPLSANYKKAGTRIFEVYITGADETGFYYLPLKEKIAATANCRFYVGDIILERQITAGKINYIDIEES